MKKRFTVEEVLARASELHILLGVEGDKLVTYAPDGALTEKARAVLGAYKKELVAYLKERGPLCACCLDLDKDNPVPALSGPYTDDFYYCKRHHPALQQERGDSHE